MNELRRFILESHFDPTFAKAVFESTCLLEAVNINKDFLIKTAGSPEKFAEAKTAVQTKWKSENMDAQLNQKAAQKVLNVLYLMEIRKPGFTDNAKLHSIHDLYLHNMLDTKFLNVVNSDTTPEQADAALHDAVAHQVQQQKTYPDLSEEEEAIWNRVKVYHEFPDGFKWVYAVDASGKITSHIPSNVTGKTMNHCGNTPRAGSDDQYWELRDADGKAYLTVILNKDGQLEESKSWGNQVNKYRTLIQPYVKWFLMDKVNGVGHRYDYGYSTHTNFGVKDFIGDDPEFINYVTEFKPTLLGNTEEKILFWKGAVDDGIVSKEQMKRLFTSQIKISTLLANDKFAAYKKTSRFKYDKAGPYYSDSVFGANPFEVLCAACGGCPFSNEELRELILAGELNFEEFVNYDIHLLTPDMQRAYVEHDPDKFEDILDLSAQVAAFKVDDDLVEGLIEPLRHGEYYGYRELLKYFANANPPEKVHAKAKSVLEDNNIVTNIFNSDEDEEILDAGEVADYTDVLEWIFKVMTRFPDIQLTPVVKTKAVYMLTVDMSESRYLKYDVVTQVVGGILGLNDDIRNEIINSVGPEKLVTLVTPKRGDDFEDVMECTSIAAKLLKACGPRYACQSFPEKQHRLLYMLNVSKEGITVPGIENIASTVADAIKNRVHGKNSGEYSDSFIVYTLGVAANPSICDLLDTGEWALYMCMGKEYGGYRMPDQYTPEIIARCIDDLVAICQNPTKQMMARLEEECVFNLLYSISGDTPTPELNKLICDLAYYRATLVPRMKDADYWGDSDGFRSLVSKRFVNIPIEEWPKWISLIGKENFVYLYIGCLSPDLLYEDESAMNCIIRLVTGHDILCPEAELATPATDDAGIEKIIQVLTRRHGTRLGKVIASKLSPMVEAGKLVISRTTLDALGKGGLINPRAYRKVLESSITTSKGNVGANETIKASDIWKIIRSPMLPQLIYNTINKAFHVYETHRFTSDMREGATAAIISGIVDKMEEKANYYQIMLAVQRIAESGLLDRMTALSSRTSKFLRTDAAERKRTKELGYDYTWWHGQDIFMAAKTLRSMLEKYKKNPIAEPVAKKKTRKASNG